ncbi:MAG: energy transducer TonB [Pyrinomonadaceae bacterium]
MGKIVKYCSACEEGFAEKFSFCPNCAKELTAFEMKPIGTETSVEIAKPLIVAAMNEAKEPPKPEIIAEPDFEEVEPVDQPVFEPVDLLANEASQDEFEIDFPDDEIPEPVMVAEPVIKDERIETVSEDTMEVATDDFEPEVTVPAAAASYRSGLGGSADHGHRTSGSSDGYAVTVISERSSGVRNGLLLGSFLLISTGFLGLLIFSIFNNFSEIPALDGDPALLAFIDDQPTAIEEEPEKNDDKKGGGGGGGGKKENAPVPQGERPMMVKNPDPLFPPTTRNVRITNPDIPINRAVKGPYDETKRPSERIGLPNGIGTDPSDGPGDGGGYGTGKGPGAGGGRGTGFGNGNGSGLGNGNGNGIGDGSGDGTGGGRNRTVPKPAPPAPKGPSSPFQILSKPRPNYTEAARKAGVTGTVSLKVTFNANGSIGSITPVNRLGFGLTEQAIAAARSITFKPEIRNGQPQTVRKTVQFNFSIY